MAKKEYVLAVDSGKFLTKAVLLDSEEIETYTIESKIKQTEQKEIRTADRFILTMDGISTLMGAEDGTIDLERSKKGETHRRSTYLAISQLIPNGSHLHLAIGTPLQTYDSVEHLEEYQKFMLGFEPHEKVKFPVEITFDINNQKHIYYISSLATYAESSGYLMNNAEDHEEDDLIGVIDIGGLNVNAAQYQRKDPNDLSSELILVRGQRMITSDLGTHSLMRSVHEKLESVLGLAINFSTMPQIISRGFYGNPRNTEVREKTAKIIEEEKEGHLESIKNDLRANGWDFNLITPVLMGGGSLLLMDAIQKDPDFEYGVTTNNAQWENVLGFAFALEATVVG